MSVIKLINILEKISMYKQIESENDYRQLAYKKAINVIYREPNFIKRLLAGEKFEGIGSKLYRKIIEFNETGDIHELHEYENKPGIQLYLWIYAILGMGRVSAYKYTKQYKTKAKFLSAVNTGRIKLTDLQKFGINNYEILNNSGNIPRKYVKNIGNIIMRILNKVLPKAKLEIMGSYRRGKETCNDIDILALIDTENLTEQTMRKLLDTFLENKNMVSEYYSISSKKFLLFWKIKIGRRNILAHVDIRFIPKISKPFAQIYFTGPGDFCRTLRSYVKKRGYLLNEYGIYKRTNTKRNLLPHAKTEKEIFDFMGLAYVKPSKRGA